MTDQGVMERPHSIESEEALLGSILIAPDTLREVAVIVTPEQFYINRHCFVYRAVLALWEDNKSIDFVTVVEELEAAGKLEDVGGPAKITQLMALVPNAYHAETYAIAINETWVRRQMIEISSKISVMAFGEQWGIDQIQSKTLTLIQDCFAGVADTHEGVYADEAMSQQYDRMEAIAMGTHPGMATGFIDMDSILVGGPRRQDLVLIAGRPGMGKTALLLDILDHNNRMKYKQKIDEYDIFFSLEMPTAQLTDRLIAKWGIDSSNIRSGRLSESEYAIYIHAVEQGAVYNFIIDDTPGLSPSRLRSKLSKYAAKHKLRNVYVDYIQLMESDNSRENRVAEVSYISRHLKLIAREFDLVLYAGAQLSRAVEQRANKRPILSDLRESGSLEQDADIVMFIYRAEIYDNEDVAKSNIAEIIIAKHRNGPIGSIQLIFRKQFMQFENAMTQKVDLNGDRKVTPKDMEAIKDFTV